MITNSSISMTDVKSITVNNTVQDSTTGDIYLKHIKIVGGDRREINIFLGSDDYIAITETPIENENGEIQ